MRCLLLVLLLAACAQDAPGDAELGSGPVSADEDAADPCGAEGYAGLVGANIAAVTLPSDLDHRVIYPDTVVTMDYRPERLNIEVTEDGEVTSLRCG